MPQRYRKLEKKHNLCDTNDYTAFFSNLPNKTNFRGSGKNCLVFKIPLFGLRISEIGRELTGNLPGT